MLVEHARNLAGIPTATHAEYGEAGVNVITLLSCSLRDHTITVELAEGSKLRRLHGAPTARERTTCSYGLDPGWQNIASEFGLRISAVDETGEVRAIERTDHPFFVGTLYQPQLSTSEATPHPVFVGLLEAAAGRS